MRPRRAGRNANRVTLARERLSDVLERKKVLE
jgi:hypothetical protein